MQSLAKQGFFFLAAGMILSLLSLAMTGDHASFGVMLVFCGRILMGFSIILFIANLFTL